MMKIKYNKEAEKEAIQQFVQGKISEYELREKLYQLEEETEKQVKTKKELAYN